MLQSPWYMQLSKKLSGRDDGLTHVALMLVSCDFTTEDLVRFDNSETSLWCRGVEATKAAGCP